MRTADGLAPPRPASPIGNAVRDIAALTRRNVVHLWRNPQLLLLSVVQPIMFVVLFGYVFGGAIQVPGGHYIDYLVPAIFVQTVLFGGASTALGLATDLKGGVIDRMRALPIARSAVLAGRTVADLLRSAIALGIMIAVGTLVGFRFHGSLAADFLGCLLILAFGYAFSWVFVVIALVVKEPEAAQNAGFVPLFILVFASSAFVPVPSMPHWLQGFATYQPFSVAVNSARALFNGLPAWHYVWQLLVWIAGILAVAIGLGVRQYRRS